MNTSVYKLHEQYLRQVNSMIMMTLVMIMLPMLANDFIG